MEFRNFLNDEFGRGFIHVNAIIAKNLSALLSSHINRKSNLYSLIDYLSEWALYFNKNKHIVEIISQRIGNYKNNDSDLLELGRVAKYLNHSFKYYNGKTPEEFMYNFLGEKEWEKIQRRLDKRTKADIEYVIGAVERIVNEELNQKNGGGWHNKKSLEEEKLE